MGTLMIDFITSLDGYGAAEGWPGWWGMESAEYLDWLGEQPEHTVLMGATTYRLMSGFAARGEEGVDELTQVSKVVFSSTLTDPLGVGQHATGDRRRGGCGASDEGGERYRYAHAGQCEPVSIADHGRAGGSIPGCRLPGRHSVRPAKTGSTTDIPTSGSILVESRTFDGGLQLLEYVPTVLVGPPGNKGAAG